MFFAKLGWGGSMFGFGQGDVMGSRHVARCGHICGAQTAVGWGDEWHDLFLGKNAACAQVRCCLYML